MLPPPWRHPRAGLGIKMGTPQPKHFLWEKELLCMDTQSLSYWRLLQSLLTLISGDRAADTKPLGHLVVGTATPHHAGALTSTHRYRSSPLKPFCEVWKWLLHEMYRHQCKAMRNKKIKEIEHPQRNTVIYQSPQRNADLFTVKEFKIIVLREFSELQENTI